MDSASTTTINIIIAFARVIHTIIDIVSLATDSIASITTVVIVNDIASVATVVVVNDIVSAATVVIVIFIWE
jgi:hypothetical protein